MPFVTQRRSLIRRLLNGRPTAPTFTRAGTATDSQGNSYAANAPRFDTGSLGQEGSSNILSANQSSVETDTTGFTSVRSAMLTRITSDAYVGSACLQVVTPGLLQNEGVEVAVATSTQGSYTGSVFVKGSGTVGIVLRVSYTDTTFTDTTVVTATLSGGFQRLVSASLTTNGAKTISSLRIFVRTVNTIQATTFLVDALQIEPKGNVTPWMLGGTSRAAMPDTSALLIQDAATTGTAAELLAIPMSGVLNLPQGSIVLRVYVGATLLAVTGTERVLFLYGGSTNLLYLMRSTTETWMARIRNNAGTQTQISASTSLAEGFHTFGVTWSGAAFTLWIDGVKVASAASPNRPEVPQTTMYLGATSAAAAHANAAFDCFHVFDEALSDSLMALYTTTPPTAPTDKHTLFLPFNGNLAPYGRGFSLGDYQAIRD